MNDESWWRRVAVIVSSIIGFIPTIIAYVRAKKVAKRNNEQLAFKAFAKARHSELKNEKRKRK